MPIIIKHIDFNLFFGTMKLIVLLYILISAVLKFRMKRANLMIYRTGFDHSRIEEPLRSIDMRCYTLFISVQMIHECNHMLQRNNMIQASMFITCSCPEFFVRYCLISNQLHIISQFPFFHIPHVYQNIYDFIENPFSLFLFISFDIIFTFLKLKDNWHI